MMTQSDDGGYADDALDLATTRRLADLILGLAGQQPPVIRRGQVVAVSTATQAATYTVTVGKSTKQIAGIPSIGPHCAVGDTVSLLAVGPDLSIFARRAEGWRSVTFTNSASQYVNAAYDPVAFRKGGDGTVRLRGLVVAPTAGASVFTLPAGYRPGNTLPFPAVSNGAFAEVRVLGDGTVVPVAAAGTWLSLASVQFVAEQ